MRLTDHVALNFNDNVDTGSVFLDLEKAFDTAWHLGLRNKLPEFKFPIILINQAY
jgi:hypothetical protein